VKVRRLGLFGGTFDPPHLGHVAALEAAARTGRFDRIVVTVAGDPYLKGPNVLAAPVRLAMAHAAFDELDLVEVSDVELRRSGPSYTVDTVRELLEDAESIDLIVGADLAAQLDGWHGSDSLRELVEVGVVPRPGSLLLELPHWRSYVIPMEPVDLSSTYVRELVPGAADLSDFLPERVIPLFNEARG
jgi:nicotinate-nucleotide adenylyltransferase